MIYIITTELFPNGLAATQRIKCYAKGLTERGYSCMVLCLNRCESSSNHMGNINPQGEIDGYSYRYMGGSTIIKDGYLMKHLNRIMDTLRFIMFSLFIFKRNDIILLYSYSPLLLKLIVFLSRVKRINVYYELNEHPSIHMPGFEIDEDSTTDLKKLYKRFHSLTGILCISTSLKDLLIKCGIPARRVHIVNMLVDSSRFEGLRKQPEEPYIAYCGAADNNKDGVNQLIEAFARINPKYPRHYLYIIGPKRSDCDNEALAKKLGVEKRVKFTGMISSDRLPQMLVNANVLALARPQSRQAKYGFPTKLGEYLLTGNPVVVTSVGDIPLFLENEVSAYLVKPDCINGFADQLEKSLSDSKAIQIGENGRKIAKQYFSNDKVISQLLEALSI